jgi:hypothetical protein
MSVARRLLGCGDADSTDIRNGDCASANELVHDYLLMLVNSPRLRTTRHADRVMISP